MLQRRIHVLATPSNARELAETGVYLTDLPVNLVEALETTASRARWIRTRSTPSVLRVYHAAADGGRELVYETDGKETHKVSTREVIGAREIGRNLLEVTGLWLAQPFHAFPCDTRSLRAVHDVMRVTYKSPVQGRVRLVVEACRRVGEEEAGGVLRRAYFIAKGEEEDIEVITSLVSELEPAPGEASKPKRPKAPRRKKDPVPIA